MIDPQDDFAIDFRTSCTADEAVAKLLGWMKGLRLPKNILVTEYGISADQLPALLSMDGPLEEYLAELLTARVASLAAAERTNAGVDVIEERDQAVQETTELIKRAKGYLIDIKDEISKGEKSALRIDQLDTDSSGVPHYTLKSVDEWARAQYKISVIERPLSKPGAEKAQEQTEKQLEEEAIPKEGLSRTITC
jgi:hypothetical protein